MLMKNIILVTLFLITLNCFAENDTYIVLNINKNNKSILVDGQTILMNNMYDELSNVLDKKGNDIQLFILFNQSLKFSDATDMKGLAQAVGFKNIRLFSYSLDTGKMIEIEINKPAVPIPINIKSGKAQ
jgi:biopolymer transport protein ExbD